MAIVVNATTAGDMLLLPI